MKFDKTIFTEKVLAKAIADYTEAIERIENKEGKATIYDVHDNFRHGFCYYFHLGVKLGEGSVGYDKISGMLRPSSIRKKARYWWPTLTDEYSFREYVSAAPLKPRLAHLKRLMEKHYGQQ